VPRRLCALALVGALLVAGCGGSDANKARALPLITIGTKNFTEQYILGELYARTLRKAGFRVDLKSNIGSSEIIDKALTAGSLDMYPEYTGVLLSEIAGDRSRPPSAAETYAAARAFEQKRGFTLLAATPFSDSNALAVLPRFAKKWHLSSIGDLNRIPGVRVGALPEFGARFEGSVGLRSVYGLTRFRFVPLQLTERYQALDGGKVDVLAVFTTEGQLSDSRYVVLRDPLKLFAYQNLAPVIRRDLVRRYGGRLTAPLDRLTRRLTTDVMRRMNAAVDLQRRKPAAVAAQFLRTGRVG
jgi:osmoprotectant transport system substrate-binding protein